MLSIVSMTRHQFVHAFRDLEIEDLLDAAVIALVQNGPMKADLVDYVGQYSRRRR